MNRKPWTYKEVEYLQEFFASESYKDLSEHLDRSIASIRNMASREGLKRDQKTYAVYQGEEMIAMGTVEECAEKTGLTEKYIYWLTAPAAKKRGTDGTNAIIV